MATSQVNDHKGQTSQIEVFDEVAMERVQYYQSATDQITADLIRDIVRRAREAGVDVSFINSQLQRALADQGDPESHPKLISFKDGEEKYLSFFGGSMMRNYDHAFFCYDVTAGPSDVKCEWRFDTESPLIGTLYSWFEKEHFDLAITKVGSMYSIKPLHKYYKGGFFF